MKSFTQSPPKSKPSIYHATLVMDAHSITPSSTSRSVLATNSPVATSAQVVSYRASWTLHPPSGRRPNVPTVR